MSAAYDALLERAIRAMAAADGGNDPIEYWDDYKPQAMAVIAVTVEACAVAAEAQDRAGREWVRDSLWADILKRAGANVRRLLA